MNVLAEIELDEIADDVFAVLDSIDVQDCWDRSGRSRDRYTAPDEAADEMIEEELQPFFGRIERYHEMGMPDQEATCCMGVLFGIYRYERESKSEFREWSVDIPGEFAGLLLDKWQKRNRATASINVVHTFIRERCPEWAEPRIIRRFENFGSASAGDQHRSCWAGAAIVPFLRSPRDGGGILRHSTQTPPVKATRAGAAATRSSQTRRR